MSFLSKLDVLRDVSNTSTVYRRTRTEQSNEEIRSCSGFNDQDRSRTISAEEASYHYGRNVQI